MKIGIILPAVPGYSETFIWSKIEGLLKYGNSISLFVNKDNQLGNVNIQVPVYSQPDIRKKYFIVIILLRPTSFFRLTRTLPYIYPDIEMA